MDSSSDLRTLLRDLYSARTPTAAVATRAHSSVKPIPPINTRLKLQVSPNFQSPQPHSLAHSRLLSPSPPPQPQPQPQTRPASAANQRNTESTRTRISNEKLSSHKDSHHSRLPSAPHSDSKLSNKRNSRPTSKLSEQSRVQRPATANGRTRSSPLEHHYAQSRSASSSADIPLSPSSLPSGVSCRPLGSSTIYRITPFHLRTFHSSIASSSPQSNGRAIPFRAFDSSSDADSDVLNTPVYRIPIHYSPERHNQSDQFQSKPQERTEPEAEVTASVSISATADSADIVDSPADSVAVRLVLESEMSDDEKQENLLLEEEMEQKYVELMIMEHKEEMLDTVNEAEDEVEVQSPQFSPAETNPEPIPPLAEPQPQDIGAAGDADQEFGEDEYERKSELQEHNQPSSEPQPVPRQEDSQQSPQHLESADQPIEHTAEPEAVDSDNKLEPVPASDEVPQHAESAVEHSVDTPNSSEPQLEHPTQQQEYHSEPEHEPEPEPVSNAEPEPEPDAEPEVELEYDDPSDKERSQSRARYHSDSDHGSKLHSRSPSPAAKQQIEGQLHESHEHVEPSSDPSQTRPEESKGDGDDTPPAPLRADSEPESAALADYENETDESPTKLPFTRSYSAPESSSAGLIPAPPSLIMSESAPPPAVPVSPTPLNSFRQHHSQSRTFIASPLQTEFPYHFDSEREEEEKHAIQEEKKPIELDQEHTEEDEQEEKVATDHDSPLLQGRKGSIAVPGGIVVDGDDDASHVNGSGSARNSLNVSGQSTPQYPAALMDFESERRRLESLQREIEREREELALQKRLLEVKESELKSSPLIEVKIIVQPEQTIVQIAPPEPAPLPPVPPALQSPAKFFGRPIAPKVLERIIGVNDLNDPAAAAPLSIKVNEDAAPEGAPASPKSPPPNPLNPIPPAVINATATSILQSSHPSPAASIPDKFLVAESLNQLKIVKSPDEFHELSPEVKSKLLELSAPDLPWDDLYRQYLGIDQAKEKMAQFKEKEKEKIQRQRRRGGSVASASGISVSPHARRRSSIDFRTGLPDFWIYMEYSLEFPAAASPGPLIVEFHAIRGPITLKISESEPIYPSKTQRGGFKGLKNPLSISLSPSSRTNTNNHNEFIRYTYRPQFLNMNSLVHNQLAREFRLKIMKYDRRTEGINPRRCLGEMESNFVWIQKNLKEKLGIFREGQAQAERARELAREREREREKDKDAPLSMSLAMAELKEGGLLSGVIPSGESGELGGLYFNSARLYIDSTHGYMYYPAPIWLSTPLPEEKELVQYYTDIQQRLGNTTENHEGDQASPKSDVSDASQAVAISPLAQCSPVSIAHFPPFPSCILAFSVKMENIGLKKRSKPSKLNLFNYLSQQLELPTTQSNQNNENVDPIGYEIYGWDDITKSPSSHPIVQSEPQFGSQLTFVMQIVSLYTLCRYQFHRPLHCKVWNRAKKREIAAFSFHIGQILSHSKVRFSLQGKNASGKDKDKEKEKEKEKEKVGDSSDSDSDPVPSLIFVGSRVYSSVGELNLLCLAGGLEPQANQAGEGEEMPLKLPLGIHAAAKEEKERLKSQLE